MKTAQLWITAHETRCTEQDVLLLTVRSALKGTSGVLGPLPFSPYEVDPDSNLAAFLDCALDRDAEWFLIPMERVDEWNEMLQFDGFT
jgi:hypothetical protein